MPELLARAPFAGLLPRAIDPSAGVLVAEESLALATMLARKGARAELHERVRETCGVELPDGPRVVSGPGWSFLGTAPGAWLAMSPSAAPDGVATLAGEFAGMASMADQSDGYAVLRLSGARIRETLAKGFRIDLHPGAFGPGSAAVTSVAHLGAILWRMPGQDGPLPAFHVAVFRSYADSFWHWLSVSAAEYGISPG